MDGRLRAREGQGDGQLDRAARDGFASEVGDLPSRPPGNGSAESSATPAGAPESFGLLAESADAETKETFRRKAALHSISALNSQEMIWAAWDAIGGGLTGPTLKRLVDDRTAAAGDTQVNELVAAVLAENGLCPYGREEAEEMFLRSREPDQLDRTIVRLTQAIPILVTADRAEVVRWIPERVPPTLRLAAIATALARNFEQIGAADARGVLAVLEELAVDSGEHMGAAATTGFLEALLAETDNRLELRPLLRLLGPVSAAFCRAWNAFCGVDSSDLPELR